jgi:exo-beta-1,3-glucanase (GH17 family)
MILLVAVWNEIVGPIFSSSFIDTDPKKLILNHRWITYEPQNYNPYLGLEPDIEQMKRELNWIHTAGFDGIITFTSRDSFALIPEIARSEGLSVIMGIWDPNDRKELTQAISKRDYIDAYCIGHNGLDQRYSYSELVDAIRYIRFHTKHPVTTTEKIERYSDKRLLDIGDWVFPDAHVPVKSDQISSTFQADASRDAVVIFGYTEKIRKNIGTEKPIMLKMITYPMEGISNASLKQQSLFFSTLLESRRDSYPDLPSDIAISVHTAFDTPWKKVGWPYYEWDPYTGLLDETGRPRPAVAEIIKRLP